MRKVAQVLVALSVAGFALAVISALTGRIGNIESEGYSRASTNLALIAIALVIAWDWAGAPSSKA